MRAFAQKTTSSDAYYRQDYKAWKNEQRPDMLSVRPERNITKNTDILSLEQEASRKLQAKANKELNQEKGNNNEESV